MWVRQSIHTTTGLQRKQRAAHLRPCNVTIDNYEPVRQCPSMDGIERIHEQAPKPANKENKKAGARPPVSSIRIP